MQESTIHAILAATVLVAGMFAFMPVDKATTVHTTLQSHSGSIDGAVSTAAAGSVLFTASGAGVVTIWCEDVVAGTDGDVVVLIGVPASIIRSGDVLTFAVLNGQAVALQDDDAATADATATCQAVLLR